MQINQQSTGPNDRTTTRDSDTEEGDSTFNAAAMTIPTRTELEEILRQAGLRVTGARIATLDLLYRTDSPLTHADVAKHLGEIGANQTTAFRNLNDLAEAGLLRRTELGDHVWRFELIAAGDQKHGHPHFLCVDCGSISCLTDIELPEKGLQSNQHIREVTEILLRGHCNECN